MHVLGNVIWVIFGGFAAFLSYFFGGLILCLTLIGIPFGLQCFKVGIAVLVPFGKKIREKPNAYGCLNILMNIIWLLAGGLFTALNHLIMGVILCITIIGIPFGKQHFKLVPLSLMPFGKQLE